MHTSTETIIVETNLSIHEASGGDIKDTSEDLKNLKRPAPESTCPSSLIYNTFISSIPELGEETPALNILNTINRTKK